jgi:hypothetical protein
MTRIGNISDSASRLTVRVSVMSRPVYMMNKKQNGFSGAMMMTQLDPNKPLTGYRSNRMFMENGDWYFKTREGDTVGPFQEELEASTQLEVYIRLVSSGLLPMDEVLRSAPESKKRAG